MSLRVDIQSAPIRQGTVDTPSAWSTSGPTQTMSGVYVGDLTKTITFTAKGAGTIGTTAVISVDWDDGEGQTGRLNLGTDHGYASDDVVYVNEGVSVAFTNDAAFAAAATFTVDVTASNRIAGSPIVISGDADPTDVQILEYARGDRDLAEYSFDGRESRVRRSTTGRVRLFTDYLNDEQRDKLLYLHASRTMVCVGENFDEDTLFLMHGGGLQPFIGDRSAFTRNTVATFPDPRTGLLRSVGANEIRVVSGQAGRALLLDAASTNACTFSSHSTPSTVWTTTGAATTLSFDTTIITPYDPADSYWNSDHTSGVARLAFSSSAVAGTDGAHTADYTVTPLRNIAGSIYVRGFGSADVILRAGAGTATVVKDTASIQLDSNWQRVLLYGQTAGGENVADIQILTQEAQGVCYMTGWQIEDDTTLISSLIQTEGATATRNLDDQTFTQAMPVPAGTISFWFYWAGGTGANQAYGVLEATGVTGNEEFLYYYQDNGAGSAWWWSLKLSNFSLIQTPALSVGWHNIVLTWQEHASTAGTMTLAMYLDGVDQPFFLGSENTTTWEPFFGTGLKVGKTFTRGPTTGSDINGFQLEELRIDKSAWTAAEALAQYERLTDDDWLHVHRAHAGRKYRIASTRESWLHTAHPDKVVMEVVLEEADREDDALVIEA